VVERLAVLAPGPRVAAADLATELARDLAPPAPAPAAAAASQPGPADAASAAGELRKEVDKAELSVIQDTLERCGGNRSLAARLLGVSRRTLYNKLARHGVE
jgi:two-component system response regulator AtoC